MQKMAESLQAIADLHDDHVRFSRPLPLPPSEV